MELEGVVHNGVIVPEGECALPEGTRVRIVPDAVTNGTASPSTCDIDKSQMNPSAERLQSEFANWAREDESNATDAASDEFFRLLDEDRPADRKLFPDDLKGVTW